MNFGFIAGLVIVATILIALAWYITIGNEIVNQEVNGYSEKNVTFAIPEYSIQYCVFGNAEKGNPVCNILDTKGKKMSEFDDFIQAFIDDRVQRSYKILK